MVKFITRLNEDKLETLGLSEEQARIIKSLLRHKRKAKKQPVKNPKTEILKVRLTGNELEKLQNFAIAKNVSASQIIRDYIHRLPAAKNTEVNNV